MLVLDSGPVTAFARRTGRSLALLKTLRAEGWWPPVVPTPVLVECLTGDGRRDARVNQFLRGCDVRNRVSEGVARRAAFLRTKARRGSAVDAILVAIAEPDGVVVTGDPDDLQALAAYASGV